MRSASPVVVVSGIALAIIMLAPSVAASRGAVAFGVGAGYDGYAGPNGQGTNSVLGFVAAGAPQASLALGGLRFMDRQVGDGMGAIAVLGVPLGARTRLRAWGTRLVGDESFRAWRVKTGPEFTLMSDRTLGIFFQHEENNLGGRLNGATSELSPPLTRAVTRAGERRHVRAAR